MEMPKDKLDELLQNAPTAIHIGVSSVVDLMKAAYKSGFIDGSKSAHAYHAPSDAAEPEYVCSACGEKVFVGARGCHHCGEAFEGNVGPLPRAERKLKGQVGQ